MTNDSVIEIKESLYQSDQQSVYRVLVNHDAHTLRVWNTPLTKRRLEKEIQLSHAEPFLLYTKRVVDLEEQPALLCADVSGISLTTFKSSLSPKSVYEIGVHILKFVERTQFGFTDISSIFIESDGSLKFLSTQSEEENPGIVSYSGLLISLWIIEHLSGQSMHQAHQYLSNQKSGDYRHFIEFSLRSIKTGLPNAQWHPNAIQSFQHISAYQPVHRWPLIDTIRILDAYQEQSIGLSLSDFSRQHQRLFQDDRGVPGPLTGQIHPLTMWVIGSPSWFQSTLKVHSPINVGIIAVVVFASCHLLFFGAQSIYISSDDPLNIQITHSGLRSLSITGNDDAIKVSRSNRDSSHALYAGKYDLTVQSPTKKVFRSVIILDEDGTLKCIGNKKESLSVQCTIYNRRIKWE